MSEDMVVELRQPGVFSEDPLTAVLHAGARRLLAQAVELQLSGFIEAHSCLTDAAGRRRLVRRDYLPERGIEVTASRESDVRTRPRLLKKSRPGSDSPPGAPGICPIGFEVRLSAARDLDTYLLEP